MLETNLANQTRTTELTQGFKNEDYFNKSPLCRKIHALLECSDFQSDVTWIAKRLGETESSVSTALSILEKFGVVTKENGQLKDNFNQIKMSPKSKDFLVDCHKVSTLEVLSGINTNSRFATYHGYQATDAETFWEFNERLKELQAWFVEKSKNSSQDLLLGYSFTAANILRDVKEDTNA